ncbi:MAG TPA: IS630 family transposase [Candidatus Atribacteria bacterium]|nr:IS630 family transposase [Candidatus Atribacteria bacterium]
MIQRLTDEELKSLIEAYNAEKDRNARLRIHCVILWGKGYDWATIKDVLMISEGMIHEVIKKYRMSGISSLTENRYKGHNYKMTAEQEKAVVKFVKEHFVTSTKVVINWIKEHWGIVYSEQGMKNFLNRHGFVYKKPKGIPGKHPSAEEQRAVIQELTSIMEECAAHEKEEIYFLDGSGFTHNLKLGYGWIEKGQEKFFKTNTSREKINVNGAYNPLTQEVIGIEHEENVNQQSNMKLIDKILEKDFKGTEKHKLYLVMDNARYNHGKLFQAHLEKWKREKRMEIEVLYLPPYSPNLNLIERLWKYAKKKILGVYYDELWKFKSAVKNFFENTVKDKAYKMELKQFIGTAFQVISS